MITLFEKNKVSNPPVKVEHPPESATKTAESNKFRCSYSIRPIYYFSRAFGLFPFTVVTDTNGDVQGARVTLFDFLWFLISICLYLLMASYCFINIHRPQNPGESYILMLGDYALLIIGLIYGAVIIALDMYNHRTFIELMKNLMSFDDEVSILIL